MKPISSFKESQEKVNGEDHEDYKKSECVINQRYRWDERNCERSNTPEQLLNMGWEMEIPSDAMQCSEDGRNDRKAKED